LRQSVVPSLFQLRCYKTIFRLGGLILPLDATGFIARLLNRGGLVSKTVSVLNTLERNRVEFDLNNTE
jgi:hypothetical protein